MIDLRLGDCLEVMRTMPANSVDAVVTDPPYGLSFMGKAWDYDVPQTEVWREVLRVLKPGGHLLVFAGTRTQHRMAVAIEDAGFEIRDMLAWCYGSGMPKSHNLKGDWQGWGTGLKPSWECITMARKPLQGTVAANVLQFGTGALNVDGCRVEGVPPSVPQPAFNSPTGKIYGMKAGEGRNGEMSQATGRWPANFIHDGSDEVVGLFPANAPGNSNKHLNSRTPTNKVYGDYEDRSITGMGRADTGSAARFFYCAKASRKDRGEGNTHETVKPTDLMRYLCRLITPPGGIVLDPFMGSGSTGKAAQLEGFGFIGIERDSAYLQIAQQRMGQAVEPLASGVPDAPAVGQLQLAIL